MVDREHGGQTPAHHEHVLRRTGAVRTRFIRGAEGEGREGQRRRVGVTWGRATWAWSRLPYVATGRRAVERETNVPKTWRTQVVGSPRMPAGSPWPAPSCVSKVRNAVGTSVGSGAGPGDGIGRRGGNWGPPGLAHTGWGGHHAGVLRENHEVTMATEEFDLEAALRNVHSAGQRRRPEPPVKRVHVFLPKPMRADQPATQQKKVPWVVKQPDWSQIGQKSKTTDPVQTSAQPELPIAPVARRRFGCSVCGSKTVQCKEDGAPYQHKCSHGKWCRTKSGHPACEECEKKLIVRVEQEKLRQSSAQQEFAANLREAEKAHPQVGWDIVEVTSASTCPICEKFLQGNRAVRVWVKKDGDWVVNNLQCLHHRPRPGVPQQELAG